MTELERYLAEEIAEDHVDGIIKRREALRRLALLGVGATAAVGHDHGRGRRAHRRARTAAAAHGHGHGQPRPSGPQGDRVGAGGDAGDHVRRARAADPAWARGRRRRSRRSRAACSSSTRTAASPTHIRNVAGRFAANGFGALALDLLSEEGGTGAFPDEAAVMAKLSEISRQTTRTRFDDDMKAARDRDRQARRPPDAAVARSASASAAA